MSIAVFIAVSNPMVYSEQAISLSMVPGIATHGIPSFVKSLAPLNEPSPPITTTPETFS